MYMLYELCMGVVAIYNWGLLFLVSILVVDAASIYVCTTDMNGIAILMATVKIVIRISLFRYRHKALIASSVFPVGFDCCVARYPTNALKSWRV